MLGNGGAPCRSVPATLPASGHAAWDDLAAWWLSRYKPSTQRTYATYAPRWVPIPALAAVTAVIDGRSTGPLLRTRSGAGMDRRSVHRYVATTARVAGIRRPIGPHALRRTVGTVGLNRGIPLRDVQRLLRHVRPETTLGSYDITGDALERHASHQIAGFLAGWAS